MDIPDFVAQMIATTRNEKEFRRLLVLLLVCFGCGAVGLAVWHHYSKPDPPAWTIQQNGRNNQGTNGNSGVMVQNGK